MRTYDDYRRNFKDACEEREAAYNRWNSYHKNRLSLIYLTFWPPYWRAWHRLLDAFDAQNDAHERLLDFKEGELWGRTHY